jgi:hypothetical protein
MNEHLLWRTEPGGVLAAEIGELRLVVRRHAPDAWRELHPRSPEGAISSMHAQRDNAGARHVVHVTVRRP